MDPDELLTIGQMAPRAVEVPLDEVRQCLGHPPGAEREACVTAVLDRHRVRLEARLVRGQRALHRLGHMKIDITHAGRIRRVDGAPFSPGGAGLDREIMSVDAPADSRHTRRECNAKPAAHAVDADNGFSGQ